MKRFSALLLLTFVAVTGYSQRAYFVDGYHGGIYGHYPVEWKTRFIVDRLAAYPEWRICLEIEPETWDTVKVKTPLTYQDFRKIAAGERIEFTNPTYAQPYCYNISGESIIRQFSYGMRKVRAHFPDVEFKTYAVEEPCFTSSLPQILKLFGFSYASLKCPDTCWGGYTAPYGGELVNWTGPDGSSVLTSPRYACEALQKNSVWQTTAWNNSDEYLGACFAAGIARPVGMCFQDAGWKNGPWIGHGSNIRNNSSYVTWREYFEKVTSGKTGDDYRMSQEDVRVSLMWGSQVLQRLARQVRRAENRVVAAEKIGVIANLATGYRYDQSLLDEAWRKLMLSQHHDCWIVPYNNLSGKRTWARQVEQWTAGTVEACDAVIGEATGGKAVACTVNDMGYIRVYNIIGEARSEPVSVALPLRLDDGAVLTLYDNSGRKIRSFTERSEDGSRVLFRADVPPFGYSTYRVETTAGDGALPHKGIYRSGNDLVMENDMYRIVFDTRRGGTVKSLVAKKIGGKEFAAQRGDFALGELRGYFYKEGGFRSSVESPAEIIVLKDNQLEKTILISGYIASHPFSQTVTVRTQERRIDFGLAVHWNGNPGIGEFEQRDAFDNNRRAFYDDRYKLNVLFPADLDSPVLFKNAPFDVCESRLEDTHFKTWDSIKHNVILNWVDLAESNVAKGYGLALLSDHTTSYSYGKEFPLGLTAQYSGGGLWGRDYSITGPLEMKFALIPHAGRWDEAAIQTENARWNEPLIASFLPDAKPEKVSFADISGAGYEITAAYLCDGGFILRLFNADGDGSARRIAFGMPVSAVCEIDLNGNPLSECRVDKTRRGAEIKVSMPRFGLKTLRVRL